MRHWKEDGLFIAVLAEEQLHQALEVWPPHPHAMLTAKGLAGPGSGGGSGSLCRPVPEDPQACHGWHPTAITALHPKLQPGGILQACDKVPDKGPGGSEPQVSDAGQGPAWHPQTWAQVPTQQGWGQRQEGPLHGLPDRGEKAWCQVQRASAGSFLPACTGAVAAMHWYLLSWGASLHVAVHWAAAIL